VAVRRAHHGNLDALIAQSSDTSGPFTFDRGSPFEVEAELAKESDRRFEVIDDDSYVVHPLERHVSNLQGARVRRSRSLIQRPRFGFEAVLAFGAGLAFAGSLAFAVRPLLDLGFAAFWARLAPARRGVFWARLAETDAGGEGVGTAPGGAARLS
jgi:hypothetical protein